MKKKDKWLKWQIGGGVTLALAMIFNSIRADPAFAIAQQKALAGSKKRPLDQMSLSKDPVLDEFRQGRHLRGSSQSTPRMNHAMPQGNGAHTSTRRS